MKNASRNKSLGHFQAPLLGSKYTQASGTTCINPQVAVRLVAAFSCGLNDRISLRENEKRRSGLRLLAANRLLSIDWS